MRTKTYPRRRRTSPGTQHKEILKKSSEWKGPRGGKRICRIIKSIGEGARGRGTGKKKDGFHTYIKRGNLKEDTGDPGKHSGGSRCSKGGEGSQGNNSQKGMHVRGENSDTKLGWSIQRGEKKEKERQRSLKKREKR